ncbi:three-Cys-motif partner protein TcmP [Neisseria brasiliensis]|uniref:three-Cys-motif partner protein TcmP n=1 Tax=Neisseria TaxID=482 RepID=UPI000C27A93E|nr:MULTISPECIES: three-Cys-motif partner protein TcmP [Neisseria]PJO79148.1 hypothetical protein CWC45_01550 [Neisseria sp. N177_16]QGL26293.1 three-Cys-motif partner protein TcmP [Neisseria brasiliensis]
MSYRPYSWSHGPAEIQQHSVAKLNVLRAYLLEYFKTLTSSRRRKELKLTIVDGFAGGGLYHHKDTKEVIHGSPLVCLESVREAEFTLNQNRTNKLVLDIDYFFIEENKDTYNHLLRTLQFQGYDITPNSKIHVENENFHNRVNDIVNFVNKKSPRNGRSIFILDQYGYSDVPTGLIRNIFHKLPKAEVILTFNIDSLINFASDSDTTDRLLKKIGIIVPDAFKSIGLNELKKHKKDWRFFIQSVLHENLVKACGAKFYTTFFIRNTGGHGDYWLIHMSSHYRARDVMTEVHWKHQNNFIHYGDAGMNMFNLVGYTPGNDHHFSGQTALGFEFDDIAKRSSIQQLMEEMPRLIYANNNGMKLEDFFSNTCNQSPATLNIYGEALDELRKEKEIIIIGKNKSIKRSGRIKKDDFILPNPQGKLL